MSKLVKKALPKVAPEDKLKEVKISSRVSLAKRYVEVSQRIKELTKVKDSLAKEIKEAAEEFNADDLGNKYERADNLVYGLNINRRVTLDTEKAKVFFESKGLLDSVLTPTIDESKIENLISKGEITLEDLNLISNVAVSYKILVKEEKPKQEEEMPEIDVKPQKKSLKKK